MAKKLNSILKGKLTGEEIGRIIIQDLITSYKNALYGKTGGIFEFEEIQLAIDNLKENHDIKTYNCYRSLHDYLIKTAQLNGIHIKQAEVCFWRLAYNINDINTAEHSNAASRFDPVIVTQKQFNEMKEKDFAYKMTWGTSIEDLLFHALDYYIELYKNDKKTPLNKYFNKAKKTKINNPRIKNNYWANGEGGYYITPDGKRSCDMSEDEWHKEIKKYPPSSKLLYAEEGSELTDSEILYNRKVLKEFGDKENALKWVEDLTAPSDATMFDVLEYASGFYASEETDSTETLWEFKEDFHELYSALINIITHKKGLEFLANTQEIEYHNNELISYKTLYNNKIFNYTSIVDNLIPDGALGGIAILDENGLKFNSSQIDENGHFIKKIPYFIEQHLTENTIAGMQSSIESWYDGLICGIRHLYAAQEAFKLISERIDIPEIPLLIDPGNIENLVDYLNTIIENTFDDIIRTDQDQAKKIKKLFKDTFPLIDLNSLKPLKENIDKARTTINDLSYFRSREDLVDIIKGGVQ